MALPLMGPGTFGQIFTFSPTRTQLTSGIVTGAIAGWCHADGTIGVLYPGATEIEHYSLESGDQFAFEQRATVSVLDGTWSFMEGTAETDDILLRVAGDEAFLQYDPQDLASMYQNAVGTLPVYRPGSGAVDPPVGLLLDKSRGLELGPELWDGQLEIYNGAGLQVGAYNQSTGELSVTAAGIVNYNPRFLGPVLKGEQFYRVSVRFSGDTSKLYGIFLTKERVSSLFAYGGISGTTIVANGNEYTYIGGSFSTYVTDTPQFSIAVDGSSVWNGLFIESISIREIKGCHAYQTTTLARPTLSGRYNLLTATETLNTQSVTTAATTYTLRFEGTGSIALSGAATGVKSAGTHTITCTAGTLTCTVAGTVTSADLRVKNDEMKMPAYQDVTDADTYDTEGFPLFLEFDQTDDQLTFVVPAGGLAGTQIVGGLDDTTASAATLSAGAYSYPPTPATGEAAITQWVLFNKALTTSETLYAKLVVNNKGRRETE